MPEPPALPALLRIAAKRCVIVGGGSVARRRAATLLEAGAHVTVIAPDIDPQLTDPPLTLIRREYQTGDLDSAALVVIATNNPTVNDTVHRDARGAHGSTTLVNRADDPALGDITIPAHARTGPITIAVDTAATSPAAAATIRDQLLAHLDPDWPRLLETIAPYRAQIRNQPLPPQQRKQKLAALTSPDALAAIKSPDPHAITHYCRSLVDPPTTA